FAARVFAFLLGLLEGRRVVLAHRPFGDSHDAKVGAAPAAAADGFGNLFYVVRNLRYEDDVRSASDAGAQRKPAGAMAHDFRHDNAMVAVGGAVKAIDGFRGDPQRGGEAE